MNKVRILHIVGTRPQYIKLYPLYTALNDAKSFEQYVYDTGQHYDFDMSEKLLVDFGLKEKVTYGAVANLTTSEQLSKMLFAIYSHIEELRPHVIIIYGDTNSTLSAAIAGAKLGVTICHVEAGVRTEKGVGIQEGINRSVADLLSDYCFCVNDNDVSNLLSEGKDPSKVYLVGDLMYDAYKLTAAKHEIDDSSKNASKVLVTIHRAENVDQPEVLSNLVDIVVSLSERWDLILPAHPRLLSKLSVEQSERLKGSKVEITAPLSYTEVVACLSSVSLVITDSGGLGKDAAYAGVPSLVLRSDPIWHELHKLGYLLPLGEAIELKEKVLEEYMIELVNKTLPKYNLTPAAPVISEILMRTIN